MNRILKKIGGATTAVLLSLFVFLNFFSGFVSGIWLIILGDWRVVIYGVIISVLMPYVYSIISLPGMGLARIVMMFSEQKKIYLATLVGLINLLFSNAIIIFWVILVFRAFNSGNVSLPFIFWGYSVCLGPLAYMAKGEDGIATSLGILLALVSYIFCVVMLLIHGSVIFLPLFVMGILFSLFNAVLAYLIMKQQNLESVKTDEIL